MPRARRESAPLHQIAAEDPRQRIAVAEVEVAFAGDRDVELPRVAALAEPPAALAAREHAAQRLDQRRVHISYSARARDVAALVQVLAVEQGQELRVLEKIVPGEFDQPLQRRARLQVLELERALRAADEIGRAHV